MNLTKARGDSHNQQGALPGEHPGRSPDPVIKVLDIAWLEFEKPDLTRAEAFARAFGFQTAQHRPGELQLRGTQAGAPCVVLRRGQQSRFTGVAFRACDEIDVLRLADHVRCTRASAAGKHRRAVSRADRPQRHVGARSRRHA